MNFGPTLALLGAAALLSGCGGATPEPDNAVSLRNLTDVDAPGETDGTHKIEGDPIATPSDTSARYYLLRKRTAIGGRTIAIVKQERGDRVAYARVELDCARRQLHILGVGDRRAEAETNIVYDGPLRSTDGLPLRQELAAFICR